MAREKFEISNAFRHTVHQFAALSQFSILITLPSLSLTHISARPDAGRRTPATVALQEQLRSPHAQWQKGLTISTPDPETPSAVPFTLGPARVSRKVEI